MLNLDTNIVLFLIDGSLKQREIELIRTNDCGLSVMVFWEIAKLHKFGRIDLSLDDFLAEPAVADLTQWALSPFVCRHHALLDFRSDPADEIICATSSAHAVPLLTRDRKLLASQVVPLAG